MTNLLKRLVGYLSGLFFILLFTSASYYTVQTVPNARLEQGDQYVTDPQKILSQEAVDQMNSLLWKLEEKKTIESAVVVLPSINEEDPDDFATDLFNHWGIGKAEDNNGLLILLLTDPEERCIIFRTGTGLQKYLTDQKCYRIQQDDMIPHMASGDYSTGLVKGVEAVVKQIESSKYKPAAPVSTGTNYAKDSFSIDTKGHPFLPLDLTITGIILFIFLIYWMSTISYQCPACRQKKLRLISSRRELEPTYTTTGLKVSVYRCTHCGHEKRDEAIIPLRRMATQSSSYRPHRHHHTTVIHTSRPRSSSSGSSWSGSSRSTSSSSSRSSYSGGRSSGSGSSSSSRSTNGGGAKSSFGSSSSRSSSSSSGRSFGGGRSSGGGARSSTGGSRSKF